MMTVEHGPMKQFDLSLREVVLVLAALHHWQEDLGHPERVWHLSYFFDDFEPYDAGEIESVCERLNETWFNGPRVFGSN